MSVEMRTGYALLAVGVIIGLASLLTPLPLIVKLVGFILMLTVALIFSKIEMEHGE